MEVAVRRASAADVPAMVDVRARSWRAAYGRLLPTALIDHAVAARQERIDRWRSRVGDGSQRGAVLVAEVDGRVAGFAFTGPSRDRDAAGGTGEVQAIYLDPPVIGRGVGRALFAAAVEDLAARGSERATLWVLTANGQARRFYEAAGWLPDGTTRREEWADGTLDETRYHLDPITRRRR